MTGKQRLGVFSAIDLLLVLALASAIVSTLLASFAAWHWPLVGDASLMRYVVFLMKSGYAPYTQIIDINLPGSYLLEAVAMKIFGEGATGLRLYDAALSLVICLCAVSLTCSFRARCCGLIAGLLLVLIHLRDGLVQAAQRDYAILAIVLVACVVFLQPQGIGRRAWRTCLFGVLAGLALIIKPTMILIVGLPIYASFLQRESTAQRIRVAVLALGSATIPVITMFAWLARWHATLAFFAMLRLVATSHQSLAQKSLGFLLIHAIQPVTVLALLCLLLAVMTRQVMVIETKLLCFAALAGLASFVVQGKGFPYQRYPFLGLLLLLIFAAIANALAAPSAARAVAIIALAFTCFWLMPRYTHAILSYDRDAPLQQALVHDLTALEAGNHDVQCLDTVGGCINVLYDLRLVQSTGYLYDCYAYAGSNTARKAYRQAFFSQLIAKKPRYIVLSSQFCLDSQGDPQRFLQWPELASLLHGSYSLGPRWAAKRLVHWWNEPEIPPSYQIYIAR